MSIPVIPSLLWLAGNLFASNGQTPTPEPSHVSILRDVPYKSGEALTPYEKARCKLDLYLPTSHHFPVLVWFHGGGLTEGSKDTEASLGNHFASEGIAVAMVNYRLSPQVHYPDYVRDAASAVAWVSSNISTHGGNPKAIFVGGHSAGAYLAMEVGMDTSHLESVGAASVRLAGLIPVSGQMATHSTVRAERKDDALGMRVDEAAPLNHVSKGLCPILNICAEHDDWKRLLENRTLQTYFQSEGLRNTELHIIRGRNHLSIMSQINTPGDPVSHLITKFIQKHHQTEPSAGEAQH